MERIKKSLKRIFFLPPVPTLIISVPAYLLVIYALSGEIVNPAAVYLSYLLSAYALIITVTGIIRAVGLVRRGMDKNPFVRKMLDHPLVDRYLKEDLFRAEAALYQGFFINLLYAGIKMFTGIFYRSVWFITLAVYYILLALMRASLLNYVRSAGKNKVSEWKRYRLCGIILLFMNIALTGIVILVVHQNSGFEYPGMLIYVMLSLETAMLTQFGAANDPMFRQIMTASTGAGISLIVVGMAIFMIARSAKQLKRMETEEAFLR